MPDGADWVGGFISDSASRRTLEATVDAGNVYVPHGTWPHSVAVKGLPFGVQRVGPWWYPREAFDRSGQLSTWGTPYRDGIQTSVPIIPPRFTPQTGLHNYHVLWEVEKWDVVTPPKDPLLLKRVSPNVFGVLAAWDLTDVERAVLRGRIG
jgi:hypothetical protein